VRLQTLKNAFPDAAIVVPFRDPLQQAASLLRQHEHFIAEQHDNRFTKEYMRWLVHHEFGADHRPFRFGADKMNYTDPHTCNYWLELWVNTYRYIVETAPDSVIFLGYESLCTDTQRIWRALARETDILENVQGEDTIMFSQHDIEEKDIDEELLRQAREVYGQCMERGESIM
jgi:hypothetical protein